ncbi:MAG TPA: hypothetical protein VLX29_08195 [Nitrospirota bacterium]|nr:hypothetical protein [Nitrospirota bacterium]HUL00820.1 hypothetical protein [Nitrospirota bacterium]
MESDPTAYEKAWDSRVGYWVLLTGKFLAGQGAVQAMNLIAGLIIIRFLPVSEYALYTIASLLLVIGTIGSDFGLSHAVNTLGARIKDDRQKLGALLAVAFQYRRMLYPVAVGAILILAIKMMYGHEWSLVNASGTVALVILTSWILQPVSLKKSVLNVHHDANGLLQVGSSEAVSRLLALAVCIIWPTAVSALIVNLIGVIVGRYFLSKRCTTLIDENAHPDELQSRQLRLFILPLAPAVIYYMFQGQISVFLLSLYGRISSIAEIGALSRLGQIMSLLMMLNAFMIQPYFARIETKELYVHRVSLVISMLLAFCLLCMIIVYWVPEWWLFILGGHYKGLTRELPLAILGSLLTLVGTTMYTMVIARNVTRGQYLYIIVSIVSQIMFISIFGIHTTIDALILNLLPAVAFIFIQSILLVKIIYTWRAMQ